MHSASCLPAAAAARTPRAPRAANSGPTVPRAVTSGEPARNASTGQEERPHPQPAGRAARSSSRALRRQGSKLAREPPPHSAMLHSRPAGSQATSQEITVRCAAACLYLWRVVRTGGVRK